MERIRFVLSILATVVLMLIGVTIIGIAQLVKVIGMLVAKIIRIIGLSVILQWDRVHHEILCNDIREELQDFITI
jgi:hypothetical protein